MVQFKLLSGFSTLLSFLKQSLHLCLHLFLKNYADNEIVSITTNLQAENFFNLSKYSVNPALKTRLVAGRKFTPYLKINVGKELKHLIMKSMISSQIWPGALKNLFLPKMCLNFMKP